MTRADIQPNEYNDYYRRYLELIPADLSINEAFDQSAEQLISLFESIPEDKHTYRYDTGKWSIKEVLQHMIDTERVFMYRCFRIGRADITPLAGFDQNQYIEPSGADAKSMEQLLEEYRQTKAYSKSLIHSLSDDNLAQLGNASGYDLSARAAAYMVPGHERWHMDIIKDRYL